jgi:hypothetical protein
MADGLPWDDPMPEREGPGVGICRVDAGGLAMCLIRLEAGLRTDPLFAGLPDDQCHACTGATSRCQTATPAADWDEQRERVQHDHHRSRREAEAGARPNEFGRSCYRSRSVLIEHGRLPADSTQAHGQDSPATNCG